MKIKATFKEWRVPSKSGLLENPTYGKISFSFKKATKSGLTEDDFTIAKEFSIEIEPVENDIIKHRVKKFFKEDFSQLKTDQQKKLGNSIKKMQPDNYALFLNKPHYKLSEITMYEQSEGKGKYEFKLEKRNKNKALEKFDFSKVDIEAINQRNISNIKALFPYVNDSICLKPDWRLTIGLGGASVYDTSITLHHIYGIPYIPSSSIKGIVRSYIIQEAFDNDEVKAIKEEDFCTIFGCSKEHTIHKGAGKNKTKQTIKSWYGIHEPKKADRKGAVTFFDAFPVNHKDLKISLDIMNVHYKEYYSHNIEDDNCPPPADWCSPTIINFLTVKNAFFQFLIGTKDENAFSIKIKEKTIAQWLKEALEEHGIGAKTAVGYGYFNEKEEKCSST